LSLSPETMLFSLFLMFSKWDDMFEVNVTIVRGCTGANSWKQLQHAWKNNVIK
jgi:hypothetical protein